MYGNKKGFSNMLYGMIAALVIILFAVTGVLPIIWDVIFTRGAFAGGTSFNGSVAILLQQIPLFIVIGLIVVVLGIMLGGRF
jgi:archaellum biogenesis protein FlaJ (TadC family)